LKRLDFCQEQGYMSSLLLGYNGIEIQRGMTTSSTAIFIPFLTKELRMGGQALYYGMNALSHNVIMADRKSLKNPKGLYCKGRLKNRKLQAVKPLRHKRMDIDVNNMFHKDWEVSEWHHHDDGRHCQNDCRDKQYDSGYDYDKTKYIAPDHNHTDDHHSGRIYHSKRHHNIRDHHNIRHHHHIGYDYHIRHNRNHVWYDYDSRGSQHDVGGDDYGWRYHYGGRGQHHCSHAHDGCGG